ncbi:NAD(P)-dependent dehydrogenase (short-subunit alcohol dehydrogenase family) [Marmoricola sp. OAE513]|uniref:SDR family oxidoreductase n=1 Tax=Marmoricola sp. OAE513 TaxID=2817894 RepID=UPI001AE866BC
MQSVAVVTGGSGGMGLATAGALGRDHHVVIADLDEERLVTAIAALARDGVSATGLTADVTDRAAVQRLFAEAAALGPVAAVAHTAGVSPQMGSSDLIVRVNALGTIHVTQAALGVVAPGAGVVLVASLAAHMFPRVIVPRRHFRLADTDPERMVRKLTAAADRGPREVRSAFAYAISKSFVVHHASRNAARFADRGARIISVSPGTFDTEMGRLEVKSGSDRMLDFAAIKRFGRPEEVADLMAFCVSQRAGYLTGVDILLDGGTRAGMGLRELVQLARRTSELRGAGS